MTLKKDDVYVDLKYGCDLMVKYFDESIVLARDMESGYNRLYDRKDFERTEERFTTKQ